MKRFSFSLIFLILESICFSQTKILYSGNSGYSLVERTNLRRYVNGKYSGLTSREVRSFISKSYAPEGFRSQESDRWYDGNFYVMEETRRSGSSVGESLHAAIPSKFKISQDGKMSMVQDNGYPTFRSFPSYSSESLTPGESWKALGERAVDPLNKGVFTRIPILVMYTFSGEEVYKGEEVFRIKAIWQTNYGFSNSAVDFKGDSSLKKALGGHKADIIVRKATGEAILIIDNVDETFFYSDGTQVNFKGNITLFTEYPPAVEHEKLIVALNRIAKKADDVPGKSEPETKIAKKEKEENSEKTESTGKKEKSEKTGKTEKSEKSENKEKLEKSEKIETAKIRPSDGGEKSSMVFEETPAGLRLSVRDIKFKADSAEILADEKSRLDEIANVLKLAPGCQFLVEGHTASTGNPKGEMLLSEQRAKRVSEELSLRGISADRFIYKGFGGNRPVSSNDTAEGRAKNRRVEITILQ